MNKFKDLYELKSKELLELESEYEDVKKRKDFIESTLKNSLVRKVKAEEQINASEDYIELYQVAVEEIEKLKEELSQLDEVEDVEVELINDSVVDEIDLSNNESFEVFSLKRMTVGNRATVNAKMAVMSGMYVILEGSLIDKDVDDDSTKWYREQNKGKINEKYILTDSIPFNYLDTATSFVLGYQSEGEKEWVHDATKVVFEDFSNDE